MKIKKKIIKKWNNISYMYTNGYLKTLPESFVNNISPVFVPRKIKLIIKDIIADILRSWRRTVISDSKVWFLVLTQNNVDALKKIQEDVPNSIFVSFYRFRSKVNVKVSYYYLNRRFLYNIIYPIKWLVYLTENKKKALRYFDLLFTVNGTYEESVRLLKKSKPKAIVFTNDHLIIARSLLLAANDLGIKTYYVQHASVSAHFPPLEFTYALLDGKDALLKYKKSGPVKSQVQLVGMTKFDDYIDQVNNNNKVETLGIAFNMGDQIDDVKKCIEKIKSEHSDLKIIARPHPAEKRNLALLNNVTLSKPSVESAFDFIKSIDCLISGDSSIHLEAVLLNVFACYYNFTKSKRFDFYGYVENGLLKHYKTIEDLNIELGKLKIFKPNVQSKSNFYNAAIGSEFYGKSTIKISKFIQDTIKS
ncbi:hypothetical protein BW723_03015 [Polaribacter reichenbachii]|uniref:UDP-N-acetylglucosamine 2-epimerase domain-containing protein n=1 Tax=Polaribacter reichenbachii TaxID=996801 RepID=A0A1B8TVY1_9FLAO|nr:hypothetical protein [Polaribacter reichenbachii]APZ45332.1 hypothetical protein BW723_03015 [Polaribacter reichenbachii]AUC19194.1 hypothetical protein BTO17_11020 [Polaribacter reichenbachii]OBY63649.1 hypothetical protein LPB301_12685 [Polaribacter reichenbachii]